MIYVIVFNERINVSSLYRSDLISPTADPLMREYPGSLKKGFVFKIRPCIETRTCKTVETPGSHFSFLLPDQVLSRLRHTLPQLYKFGLSRTPPE